jgi:hypothetical protein
MYATPPVRRTVACALSGVITCSPSDVPMALRIDSVCPPLDNCTASWTHPALSAFVTADARRLGADIESLDEPELQAATVLPAAKAVATSQERFSQCAVTRRRPS